MQQEEKHLKLTDYEKLNAHPSFSRGNRHDHEMKMESKPHTCADACKDGSHTYLHGEAGHTCTAACKMDMKEEDKK